MSELKGKSIVKRNPVPKNPVETKRAKKAAPTEPMPKTMHEKAGLIGMTEKLNEIRIVLENNMSAPQPQAPVVPVKTRKPRAPLTDEQRAKACEHLAKAREARARNLEAKRSSAPQAITA